MCEEWCGPKKSLKRQFDFLYQNGKNKTFCLLNQNVALFFGNKCYKFILQIALSMYLTDRNRNFSGI